MRSPRVTVVLTPKLFDAATKAASKEGISVGEWLRRLAENATGVPAEAKEGGLAHVSKRRRKQIAMMGVEARREQADK